MVHALLEQLEHCQAPAVVITTEDPRCFCSGADLSLDDHERAEVSDLLYELYRRMITQPAPIIVALQGPAIGGGAQLAVAADLRIAEPGATLRFMGPGHGLAVGAWALTSLVGRGRAMDLCLTMRTVDAGEAVSIGLVDRVVPDAREAALEIAAQLVTLDASAVHRVKRIVLGGSGLLAALESERAGNRASWSGSVEISAPKTRDA
jgi:enoyl-CoA hydratase